MLSRSNSVILLVNMEDTSTVSNQIKLTFDLWLLTMAVLLSVIHTVCSFF